MQYKSIKGVNGWGQVGLLVAFLGAGFIMAAIAQMIIFMQILPAGTDLMNMAAALKTAMLDSNNSSYLQIAQVLGTLCLFFIPALLFNFVVNGRNMFWLGFNKYFTYKQVILAFGIIFCANIVAGPLAELSKTVVANFPSLNAIALKMEAAYNEQLLAMSKLDGWGGYIIALFIIAFFPAVFEEVFFRGVVQNLLVKWSRRPFLGIIVASLIFSLIHASIFLFLSRFILGMALGYLYHKSKNIWINIIAHFINNGIAVTQLFFLTKDGKTPNIDELDPSMPWWLGILGLIAVVGLFYLFDRVSVKLLPQIDTKEKLLIAEKLPFHDMEDKLNESGWA